MSNMIRHFQTGDGKYAVTVNIFIPVLNKEEARKMALKYKKAIESVNKMKIKEGTVLFD